MLPRHHTARHSRLRQRPATVSVHADPHLEGLKRDLTTEARTLRGELENLHESRQSLQYEFGSLMGVLTSFGPGGEFEPDWKPIPPPDPPQAPQEPPAPEATPPPRSGWRKVNIRNSRVRKLEQETKPAPQPTSAPTPAPAPISTTAAAIPQQPDSLWDVEPARYRQETFERVRSPKGHFDGPSSTADSEIRVLLEEVRKLREERRDVIQEISDVLLMKSQYAPGGVFEPDFSRQPLPPPPPDLPSVYDVQPPPKAAPGHAPHQPGQSSRNSRQAASPVHRGNSWSMWLPDPNNEPSPSSVALLIPELDGGSPGLFGPRSPTSSMYHDA